MIPEIKSLIASINVLAMGQIEVRRDDLVLLDGRVIATNSHMQVLAPGDPLDDQDPRVTAVAEAVWTPDVVKAWQDFRAAQTF